MLQFILLEVGLKQTDEFQRIEDTWALPSKVHLWQMPTQIVFQNMVIVLDIVS